MMMINNGVGALLLVPLALSPTRFGELGHVHEIAAFDARQWALLLLSCINGVDLMQSVHQPILAFVDHSAHAEGTVRSQIGQSSVGDGQPAGSSA